MSAQICAADHAGAKVNIDSNHGSGVQLPASTMIMGGGRAQARCCAGVAAGFNAPISGVFFAVETVLQKRSRTPAENSGTDTCSQLPHLADNACICITSQPSAHVLSAKPKLPFLHGAALGKRRNQQHMTIMS